MKGFQFGKKTIPFHPNRNIHRQISYFQINQCSEPFNPNDQLSYKTVLIWGHLRGFAELTKLYIPSTTYTHWKYTLLAKVVLEGCMSWPLSCYSRVQLTQPCISTRTTLLSATFDSSYRRVLSIIQWL